MSFSGDLQRGDIVLVHYAFSDGTATKLRPALLMAITSQADARHTHAISNSDLVTGQLPKASWLKANSVTATHLSRISRVVARVKPSVLQAVHRHICPRLGCQ
jgi:hypothetical protein